MTTLFVSDLHLDAQRPEVTDQFLEFLQREAVGCQAFYILGDLFEAWIGDDDPDPEKARVLDALRAVTQGGPPGFFMRGNRDFLIGETFCRRTGFELLEDPTLVDLYGDKVLLMHGDTLCTDDVAYQQFRAMVRNPAWQEDFLSKPFEARLQLASQARTQSEEHIRDSKIEIMDVNQEAVEKALMDSGVTLLLHGHTHRPNVHRFQAGGHAKTRIVLGDWYAQGSVLRWDESGYDLQALPREH